MKLRIPFLLSVALPLAIAAAAPAVIIDSANGAGNTSAPSPDPGFGNVGICNGLSCVYLSDGWVLTANHVGAADATFGGVTYPWLASSGVRLHNQDSSFADLALFRLQFPYPPLSALSIASSTATSSATHPLYLIGNGRNRGAATTWNPCGPGSYSGWSWGPGSAIRWGTNRVDVSQSFQAAFGTWVFGTVFDDSGFSVTAYEAQGAIGDSGGAVFAWTGSSYELAGIIIGVTTFVVPANPPNCPVDEPQPAETSIYGNETFAADLSVYRDEIVAMPEPAGGLWAGAALLAWLSAGTRRACRGTGCAASSPPRA